MSFQCYYFCFPLRQFFLRTLGRLSITSRHSLLLVMRQSRFLIHICYCTNAFNCRSNLISIQEAFNFAAQLNSFFQIIRKFWQQNVTLFLHKMLLQCSNGAYENIGIGECIHFITKFKTQRLHYYNIFLCYQEYIDLPSSQYKTTIQKIMFEVSNLFLHLRLFYFLIFTLTFLYNKETRKLCIHLIQP